MRAVVQRVLKAGVTVEGRTVGEIERGFVILLGVGRDDARPDADYLAEKIINLRVFNDEHGKMNLSLLDIGGQALVISQFTVYGDARKGRRPSYVDAAEPETARTLYEYFVDQVRDRGLG